MRCTKPYTEKELAFSIFFFFFSSREIRSRIQNLEISKLETGERLSTRLFFLPSALMEISFFVFFPRFDVNFQMRFFCLVAARLVFEFWRRNARKFASYRGREFWIFFFHKKFGWWTWRRETLQKVHFQSKFFRESFQANILKRFRNVLEGTFSLKFLWTNLLKTF